jgi:two-component system capsular synthesis response regulator RcsB
MRIVIADDHPIVLMGLRIVLQRIRPDCIVVGEAVSGEALLALLERHRCDLLITDFPMPAEDSSVDGLLLIRQIGDRYPMLPIIMVTMLSNPSLLRGMLGEGVRAIVEKAAVTKELMAAIQTVISGHTYVSSSLRTKLATGNVRHCNPNGHTSLPLSLHEAEIVRMLSCGLVASEVARRMGRSVKTISQQKRDAMRKLGVDSDVQLFKCALTYGL